MADIGTQWVDLVAFVIGARVSAVMADLFTFHRVRRCPLGEVSTFSRAAGGARTATCEVNTEDYASVLLEFENGARGNLAVSQGAAGRKNCIRVQIYGSKLSVGWCSEDPEVRHFGRRDEPNATAVRAMPAFGRGRGRLHGPSARPRRRICGHVHDELPSDLSRHSQRAARRTALCDCGGRARRGGGGRSHSAQRRIPPVGGGATTDTGGGRPSNAEEKGKEQE